MGKLYLVMADFRDDGVPLHLCKSRRNARNLAEMYAGNFDRMWFNNKAVELFGEEEFIGTYLIEFVDGNPHPTTDWFAAEERVKHEQ